jgi:hypothetical protein
MFLAKIREQVRYGFCICLRFKFMAALLKFCSEFRVILDDAVVNDSELALVI